MALFEQVTMSDGSVHGNGLRWVEWYWILIQTPLEVKAQMTPFFFFFFHFMYRQSATNSHDTMFIFLAELKRS